MPNPSKACNYEVWRDDEDRYHRDDGPAIIIHNQMQIWYQHGIRHREDGPALLYSNGSENWYQNGELHRIDGPAITYPNGTKQWYVNGKQIHDQKSFQQQAGITEEEMTLIILKYGDITPAPDQYPMTLLN